MNQIAEAIVELGTWTLRNSIQGGILIALLGVLYLACRKHVATGFWIVLWIAAGFRLVIPSAPESSFSLFNLVPTIRPSTISVPVPAQPPVGIIGSEQREISPLNSGPKAGRLMPAPKKSPSLPIVLSSIWLVGALSIPLLALTGYFRMANRIRRYLTLEDHSLNQILRQCARETGIEKPPILVEGKGETSPALFGGLRPTHLIVPRHFTSQYSPSEIKTVFLHEMAHIRRGDLLWNWITLFVESLHWFNPLVWWAGRRFTAERELLCDRFVLRKLSGKDYHNYGETLIKALEYGIRPSPAVVPFLSRKSELKHRLQMMTKQTNHLAIHSIAAALAIAACAITFTSALSQEREGASDRSPEGERSGPRDGGDSPPRGRSNESDGTSLRLTVLPDGVIIDDKKIALINLHGELENREISRAFISSRPDTPFQNITTVLNSLKSHGIWNVKLSVEDETVSIGREGGNPRGNGPRDGETMRREGPRDGENARRPAELRDGGRERRDGPRDEESRRRHSSEEGDGNRRSSRVSNGNQRHISQWTRIYGAYDKDDDEKVTFDEWLSMKEGDMPRDRREREKGWFDQADENGDGVLTLGEWIDWKSNQISGRE